MFQELRNHIQVGITSQWRHPPSHVQYLIAKPRAPPCVRVCVCVCVCVCVFALLKLSLITEKSTKPCSVKKYRFHQKARFGNFQKRKAIFLLCGLCFFSQDAESSGTGPPATEGPPTPGPLTRGRWELLDGSDFVVLTKSSFLVKQMTLQCGVLSIWIRGCVLESVSCHLLSLSLQKNLGQILLSVTRLQWHLYVLVSNLDTD